MPMKAKIVYGSPCSGKTTYVRNNAGNSDFIFDYDRLLVATTDRVSHLADKHALHWLILDLRQKFVESAKSAGNVEVFWLVCSWNTSYIKALLEGVDSEEIFIEATKEECYRRLENDETRPDKDEWKLVIDEWFEKHSSNCEEVKAMAKFWNFLRDDAGERILRLDGAISETTWFGDEVTPKFFRDDLNAGDGDITVWLNSPGGDVFAATEIFNMLKEYGDNRGLVTVKIDSLAASAASIIAMAGDVIEISPVGMIMIHNPATIAAGDADEMKAAAKMLGEVKESIINAYGRTNLSREQLSRMMDAETWMNANKAVELRFADKIIGSENQPTDEQSAKIFSAMQVTNSVADAFKAKRDAEKKFATADKRVDAAQLRRRLELLKR